MDGVCDFSTCGNYFASCQKSGKLQIWETKTGTLLQTQNGPSFTSCTCLKWESVKKYPSSGKKKRKSLDRDCNILAVGTKSGKISLYSKSDGKVVGNLEGGQEEPVNCLAWYTPGEMFAGVDRYIVRWNAEKSSIVSRWKAERRQEVTSLAVVDISRLLSACTNITLWDIEKKEVLRTYTGHSSDIRNLIPITSEHNGEEYFFSATSEDRLISAWQLSDSKNHVKSVVSFLSEDNVVYLDVGSVKGTQATCTVAVSMSGVLHVFAHQLNGHCKEPIKPKVSVHVVNEKSSQPLRIIAACLIQGEVLLAYGDHVDMSFERITTETEERYILLSRQHPKIVPGAREDPKVRQPETAGAQYVGPSMLHSAKKGKRTHSDSPNELPMEERLNNLTFNPDSTVSSLKADNVMQMLAQGIQSNNERLINEVLLVKDDRIITNTVLHLPVQLLLPLVNILASLMYKSAFKRQMAMRWLHSVLRTHTAQVLSSPGILQALSPICGMVEAHGSLLSPLSQLHGRLTLLMDQLQKDSSKGAVAVDENAMLVYQDESSDEESVMGEALKTSESEDHWDEWSDVDDDEEGSKHEEMDVSS